jgi:thymidylate synthase (FAD)
VNTAKIIAMTEPKIWTDAPGDPQKLSVDEFIAYVARVSNPSNQNNSLTASKLLKYLAKHKHWSPFEMVDVVMEINTTRDIGRQILRHRSFRFQEFSQRYADPTKDMGFVTREARLQDTKNRQNSIEISDDVTYDFPVYERLYDRDSCITKESVTYEKRSLKETWAAYQKNTTDAATAAYNWAIEHGIAKEQARAVLPEGLILSRMYMAGSLRSWIHYCEVRTDASTQKEHREIAMQAWDQITDAFPSLKEVLASLDI